MGVGGQLYAPAALPTRKSPGTHCTGGWVGPRASLDGCGKSRSPPPGFDPRTVQPVASRYTDYVLPAHGSNIYTLPNLNYFDAIFNFLFYHICLKLNNFLD